jgi:hypothetical protein
MNDQKSQTKYKYFFFASLALFISSLSFQVYISNATALKGKDFQNLYERKVELEKDIAYLEFEESQLSSLSYIEKAASDLGFQEMTEPLLPITPPALAALNTQ